MSPKKSGETEKKNTRLRWVRAEFEIQYGGLDKSIMKNTATVHFLIKSIQKWSKITDRKK